MASPKSISSVAFLSTSLPHQQKAFFLWKSLLFSSSKSSEKFRSALATSLIIIPRTTLYRRQLILVVFLEFTTSSGTYCILMQHPVLTMTAETVPLALVVSWLCHIAQVIKGDNDVLLKGVGDKSAIEEVKHILEMGEKGAHILIVPELVEFLMLTLDKVANVSVSCTQIPLLTLEYEPPRLQSLMRAPVPSETETIPKPSVRQPKEEAKSSPQPDTKLPKKVQKDAETKVIESKSSPENGVVAEKEISGSSKLQKDTSADKEREKKAKKAAASTAAANPEVPTEAVADASEPEKVDDVNADAPVPAPFSLKDKVQKENIIRYRNRTKGSESLPRAILKRKKSINYWIWAASTALVVLILLALGYYYLV
ncbi:hypothetical protein CRYUN_Cryun25bG0029400 [Craigia yunnanensis]